MRFSAPRSLVLQEYFEPVLGRALRSTLALALPLVWGLWTRHMEAAVWAGVSAQLLSNATIRGGYGLRLRIVAVSGILCSLLSFSGVLAGHWIWLSTLMMALLAFAGGYIRQSGDHGPAMVLAGLLLYLLGIDAPGTFGQALNTGLYVLAGSGLAVALLLLAWPFVPFSPLRRSVALNWKALADWLGSFSTHIAQTTREPVAANLDLKERTIRESISHSMQELSRRQALRRVRSSRLSYQMVEMRRIASLLAASLYSMRSSLEQHLREADTTLLDEPYLQRCLESLGHTCYRISLALVSNRKEDATLALLRIRRAQRFFSLLKASRSGRMLSEGRDPLLLHLSQAFSYLAEVSTVLDSLQQASGSSLSFRNFLQDAQHWQRMPAVSLDLNPDSFLFRFAGRLAATMALGVLLFKALHIPHGYWISMTVMIILQPEFGATYLKAGRRILGTLAGAVAGGLLIVWHLPAGLSMLLLVLCSMLLVVFLNRQYAISAFFITVQLILLFHILEPVAWPLALMRVANTLMGCALAILGGYAFWPLWERKRFPMLLREAIEKNHRYLDRCLEVLLRGQQVGGEFYLQLRREAEIASYNAFDSALRMASEPSGQQQDPDRLYALAGSTLHLNRDITALTEASRQASQGLPAEKIPMLNRWFHLQWKRLEQLLLPSTAAPASKPAELPPCLELPESGSDPLSRQLLRLSEELAALETMLRGDVQQVSA